MRRGDCVVTPYGTGFVMWASEFLTKVRHDGGRVALLWVCDARVIS